MLSTSHNRAYQAFLTLLTDFHNLGINSATLATKSEIRQEFFALQQWFGQNITTLDQVGIEPLYVPRWESIQREIRREFQLLGTDILFWASARQEVTKMKRLKNISDRLNKLSSYCQMLLENEPQI